MTIAIIGAGMAGMACAYILKQYEIDCIVYEGLPAVASQGSGNPLGMYNPRFAAHYTPEAEFYKTAFETALETFPKLEQTNWNPCGALHLMTNDQKTKRFTKMASSWPWDESQMTLLGAEQASSVAGVPVNHDALYLPQSGAISPPKLCAAYAQGIEVKLNHPVTDLKDIDADIIILACGLGMSKFTDLPIKSVRGQITDITAIPASQNLKTALCYSGYTTPAVNGTHHTGSTFQRWLDHTDIMPEDDQDNISKLTAAVPALAGEYTVTNHRAALRVTSPDHFPMIGAWDEKTYVSTAHGSHGILSSLMGAHIIAAMITGHEAPVSQDVIDRLDPHRFA